MSILDKKEELKELNEEIKEVTESFDSLQYLSIKEAEERYDDFINDVSEKVVIGNLSYDPARVLKAVDETAYNVGLHEYFDSIDGDIQEEIDNEDYSSVFDYVEGFEDKIDRKEELEEEIEELESKREVKKKKKLKP